MKFVVFGGGGKVAQHFARLATGAGHKVISVVRNEDHFEELKAIGAVPVVLSLEDAAVPEFTELLTSHKPDTVIFAAGAGGRGDKSRTRKVDYEGAVKVYDAMEAANVKRLLVVGAVDIRDRSKGYPDYYSEDSKKMSDRMYAAIPEYMQAKYDAEVELHSRKQLQFTVVRPGGLTDEPAAGADAGFTQLTRTSRELVAKALLVFAQDHSSAGLSIDLMDGQNDLGQELKKAVDNKMDSWTG